MHTSTLFYACVIAYLQGVSASCLHGTTLMPRQAEGEALELPNFDYGTTRGPTNWHSLEVVNSDCALGSNQSPINIDSTVLAKTGAGQVVMDIPQQNVKFENLGTNVEVVLNGSTSISGGTPFALKQFHYHTPSEHRINGEYFPVEVHMVHESPTDPNQIAVVGMLFQLSSAPAATNTFSTVLNSVNQIPTPGNTIEIDGATLDLASISAAVANTSFHKYTGSLTTPPCSEGVTFMVSETPLEMDVNTFNAMKSVVKFNSRYTQNTIGGANLLALSKAVVLGSEVPLPAINVAAPPAVAAAPPAEAAAPPAEAAAPPAEAAATSSSTTTSAAAEATAPAAEAAAAPAAAEAAAPAAERLRFRRSRRSAAGSPLQPVEPFGR